MKNFKLKWFQYTVLAVVVAFVLLRVSGFGSLLPLGAKAKAKGK